MICSRRREFITVNLVVDIIPYKMVSAFFSDRAFSLTYVDQDHLLQYLLWLAGDYLLLWSRAKYQSWDHWFDQGEGYTWYRVLLYCQPSQKENIQPMILILSVQDYFPTLLPDVREWQKMEKVARTTERQNVKEFGPSWWRAISKPRKLWLGTRWPQVIVIDGWYKAWTECKKGHGRTCFL